jgi:hypothetical protein
MHHRAGDFFAFVHHASSIALTESRKTLEKQGLRAHQTRFFTHTLWRRAIFFPFRYATDRAATNTR